MPRQRIFRERFLVKIKGDIEKNLYRYTNNKAWIDEVTGGVPFDFESRIKIPDKFALIIPTSENLRDFENSRRIFEAFPDISRVQAADPRFWTYMTHVTCWEYMRARWNLERTSATNQKDYILTRYFIKGEQSRALLRNGIARLWWYAYLTYDESREDPYELTGVLLKRLDIAQQVLERSYGRNGTILHGFLGFLLENPELTESGNKNRIVIRQLAIALNFRGGVSILDNLSTSEIMKFLYETRGRIPA